MKCAYFRWRVSAVASARPCLHLWTTSHKSVSSTFCFTRGIRPLKEHSDDMARQAPTDSQTEEYRWREPSYSKAEVWVVWLLWILPILATVVTIALMALRFLGSGGPAALNLPLPLGR